MEIVKCILFTFNAFMGVLFAGFGVSDFKKKSTGSAIGAFVIMSFFVANIVYLVVS